MSSNGELISLRLKAKPMCFQEKEGKLICPKCKNKQSYSVFNQYAEAKYCVFCGQRLMRNAEEKEKSVNECTESC